MCGRYYIDDDMKDELEKLIHDIDQKIRNRNITGDMKPSMQAPVIYQKDRQKRLDAFQWGFKKYQGNGLVINARAESVFEKRMFSGAVANRRCIIPASGFYEWDALKNKFHFTDGHKKILYMAGIFRMEEENNHFVILTTEANNSMKPVHDRMPVILQGNLIDTWLYDDNATKEILGRVPPLLCKEAEIEQLKFEF